MTKEKKEITTPADSIAEKINKQKEYFITSSSSVRSKWVECYQAYQSWLDSTLNPFLANLFIPKTHESVELLTSFLIGENQSIAAEPEGKEDTKKAMVVGKLLEYQWRKVLMARNKIITWVKQGLIFGNGIMKVGWDFEKDEPFMECVNLPDIYFDYYIASLQDSSVIHRIIRKVEDVKNDEKYNSKRKEVVSMSDNVQDEKNSRFDTYDHTVISAPADDVTELLEAWTDDKVITIAPTSLGYQVIRSIENPFGFKPFVKLKIKNNPLPNRAYDTGAIEPTLKIQRAFNDAVNLFFDDASLINNPMSIERRGANITPTDKVRRPGGSVKVDDINADFKWDAIPDIKNSLLELIKFLDEEFQQASMVNNLLKGMPGAEFATEAAIGQSNTQQLLNMVDGNIKDALSELGQMIIEINLQNITTIRSIKVLDNDKETIWMDIDPKQIQGQYDIKISADRSATLTKAVRQKQLINFSALISKDPLIIQKYPSLPEKVYRKWLEDAGFGDIDYFFEQAPAPKDIFNRMETLPAPKDIFGRMGTLPALKPNTGNNETGIMKNVINDISNI